jgi:4-oxalocrotonate tautomerase
MKTRLDRVGAGPEQKEALVTAITNDVMGIANASEAAVSIAIEDYPKEDWPEAVYRPYILEYEGDLRKAPGYPKPVRSLSPLHVVDAEGIEQPAKPRLQVIDLGA